MKRTAAAIAEGEFDRRVPGDEAHTEVGRALNTMLGRIEGAFAERDATEAELGRSEEGLRRFVADASHELRTPLAAVTAYAEIELRAERPVEVVGDATRLRQVVDNLLANVRAHTPPGTTADIAVSDDNGEVVVEVADDGPGLTDEQAGRVFERSYRADPSRSRRHGGTGLGLGIVAAIVAAHGGSVDVVSAPGAGTAIRIRLPEGPPDHERAPSEGQGGLHGAAAG